MAKHCFFCGAEVGDNDWAYCGPNRINVCDQQECQRTLQAEDRAAYENAQEQLHDDWYGR